MAQADGSVIIDTKMNNDALEKGFERLKSDCESLGITCEKAGDKIKASFFDIDIPANIQNAVAKLTTLQDKLASSIENSGETANMAVEAEKKLIAAQTELAKLEQEKAPIEQILKTDEYIDPATYIEAYEKIDKLNGKIIEQEKAVKQLQGEYSKIAAEADRAASMEEKTYAQVEAAQRRLTQVISSEANKRAAKEEAAARRQQKANEKAYAKSTKAAKSFGKRLTRILTSALVFNVISKGLREVTQYFGKALKSNKEFSQSWDKLKGALLTAFQPLYETLLPAITEMTQVFTKLALVVGRFFASVSGKNSNQMKENAEALYDQANATEELGDAANKAKKGLAGFDEINTLGSNDTSSSSSTADFNLTGIDLDSKLSEMVVYTSAAILALGIILAFSGVNIPLGIGMIALGAIGLYQSISENWGELGNRVGTTIDAIMAIGGALILAIGIILVCCTPQHMALGIGMIIAGGVMLASAVALNWNSIVETLQTPLGAVVGLLSGAVLVVIGILLCIAQAWPLGIGLIVAGAAFIGTTVAVNWNSIVEALRGPIGLVVALVSGALLALGVILVCCGIIPLGIGLIIAGAAGLVTVVAVNWNAITEKVKEIWQSIKNFWNKYIAPIFTLKWWKDLAIKCGNGLIAGFEGAINGIISMFEKMINWVVGGLNKISFDVPDWVPGIGGKKFGFNIPEVSFGRVSIPRLAQGAVIPANQEFLAVLGDQKHGTNVEAPLETIQEAVALVMEDMTNGMMAGFEALLEENQRLRTIVEGIEVGDSTIGQAANRYNQRMAIIRG